MSCCGCPGRDEDSQYSGSEDSMPDFGSEASTDSQYYSDENARIIDGILRPLLQEGAIALIDVDWLVDSIDTTRPVPRRQELPFEALVKLDDLENGIDDVIVLSYMWLTSEHPDPDGAALQLLLRALRCFISSSERQPRYGVFWDYLSLYQKPRSPDEDKAFRNSLNGISYLFVHPDSLVFLITELPMEDHNLQGHNNVPYMQRGWPFAELSWSSLVKAVHGRVFDLSKLGDADDYFELDERCATDTRLTPLTPRRFQDELRKRSFSNGKDDCDRVSDLYRSSFVTLFSHMTCVVYRAQGWDSAQGEHLVEVVQEGYAPILTSFMLQDNYLDSVFCTSFANAAVHDLKYLNLSHNPIGDEGVAALSPVLVRTGVVVLEDVGMTPVGCLALCETWCSTKRSVEPLRNWNLDGNALGDEGVGLLSPFMTRSVLEIHLSEVGLTDAGCRALAASLCGDQSLCQNVRVVDNNIERTDSLSTMISCGSSLRELNVAQNPVCKDRAAVEELDVAFQRKSVRLFAPEWMGEREGET